MAVSTNKDNNRNNIKTHIIIHIILITAIYYYGILTKLYRAQENDNYYSIFMIFYSTYFIIFF